MVNFTMWPNATNAVGKQAVHTVSAPGVPDSVGMSALGFVSAPGVPDSVGVRAYKSELLVVRAEEGRGEAE